MLDLLVRKYFEVVGQRERVAEIDEYTAANLVAVAQNLTAEHPKLGMWFYGKPGNGKTTMVYTIMRATEHLAARGYFKYLGDYFVPKFVFKTAKEIAEMSIDREKKRDYNDLKTTNLLVIDDLGTDSKEMSDYGNTKNPIMDFIFERYRFQAYTLVTANIGPGDIANIYDDRMADRCREMFKTLRFQAPTYRRKD